MKSVYLASPFFSPAQKERIAQVKAALEKNPTIDEKAIFVPHENEYTKAEFGSLEWQKAAFQLDTSQIDASDVVVAIVDYKLEETKENEPDSGTAFEIGYAYATRTPVIVIQFDSEKEVNLMIAQGLTAYFDVTKEGLKALEAYDFDLLMPKYCPRPVI
ncbi:nucleoside 2-deoxyribosyltransferase [Ligilactobacillus faecis]|uniref:Nucleoside 2-deoxyribosyltransferase n=1 Tax=Ligilactobacillus faecis TaxID=762833 RepID=A0ABV4DLE1_9LACO|nr:nucleoside 2-deoxyribosyltransferase [Ligilactobacillus faecis]WGN90104.1 nucleoside 2-deoxyribosyltransferase [Ligilactobacillus faecis]